MDGWLVVGHGRPRRLAKLTPPPQPTVSKVKHHGDQHVSSGEAHTPTVTRTDAHMSKRKTSCMHEPKTAVGSSTTWCTPSDLKRLSFFDF